MARGSREVWDKRVQRWKDSGLTAKEFAAEVGINAGTLTHWSWRLGSEARAATGKPIEQPRKRKQKARSSAADFIEISAPIALDDSRFEVQLRGGRRVFVPANFEAESFGRLVAVLEARQ